MKAGLFFVTLFVVVQSIGLYTESVSTIGIIVCLLMTYGAYILGRIDEM